MNTSFREMTNPNIIFVIDSLVVGGAESQLVMLVQELHYRGYHCEVFALRAQGALLDELISSGIPVTDGGLAIGKDRSALMRGLFRLWHLILTRRPCVVHTYLPLSNFLGSVMARLAFASVVITSRRGLGKHQEWNQRWKYLDRISNALSSKITANSFAVARDTLNRDRADPDKIVIIRNGIDFTRFSLPPCRRESMRKRLGIADHEFSWVKVANLVDYKGHADLLKAFSLISSDIYSRLYLVGRDRGALAYLKELSTSLGISDRVVFLGDRTDVPDILSSMDGYVTASHTEGFSNALLEAMASGLPVIATSIGGNTEALQSGSLGLLVPPHDHKALSHAMKLLMRNQSLRHRLSTASKANVYENYSAHKMTQSYIKLYSNELYR
jgi:glycosyltransferase involved in cell wall biosynthesis